jgi:hypothetical protein
LCGRASAGTKARRPAGRRAQRASTPLHPLDSARGRRGHRLRGLGLQLFSLVEGGLLLARASALPESEAPARVVALADDGRLVALDTRGQLTVDGQFQPGSSPLVPALALRGTDLVSVREGGGIDVFGLEPGGALLEKSLSSAPFRYGLAHAFHGGRIYLASGDWEPAQSFDLDAEDGVTHFQRHACLPSLPMLDLHCLAARLPSSLSYPLSAIPARRSREHFEVSGK